MFWKHQSQIASLHGHREWFEPEYCEVSGLCEQFSGNDSIQLQKEFDANISARIRKKWVIVKYIETIVPKKPLTFCRFIKLIINGL